MLDQIYSTNLLNVRPDLLNQTYSMLDPVYSTRPTQY